MITNNTSAYLNCSKNLGYKFMLTILINVIQLY